MEQQLEQSLVANIGLSEKTRYEYIFVDANNRIHISVPLSSGTEIALDNTCKTAAEIRTFAGLQGNQGILISIEQYARDLTKDITNLMEQDALSQELETILQRKQQRLAQLQNAQNLLQSLIPPLQASAEESDVSRLPELIKKNVFKTNRENGVSIVLYPPHRDDYLNTEELALFALKRGNLSFANSFGGKLSASINAQLWQYKNLSLQQVNAKITTIEGIFEAVEKTWGSKIDLSQGDAIFEKLKVAVETVLVNQGLKKADAELLTNQLFLVNYRGDKGSNVRKPISAQYIIQSEMLDDDDLRNYSLKFLSNNYLLGKSDKDLFADTVQPLQLLLQETSAGAPESKFFNIKEPGRFSVAVQFFLGIADVHYYQTTGKHINFAETLEGENGQELITGIYTAIMNNEPIEPVIFKFINETLLADTVLKKQPKLSDTDQTTIIQQFNALYNLVKDSDHMDEFFLLIPREGHYVTHQGRICVQLSEYCKRVNPILYQQFFGGANPRLASQPLASHDNFILSPSNKETIQIGSISVDFTHINQRSVEDLVRILLTEDPIDPKKRFFHTVSDAIKTQFKNHPQWVTIQNYVIGSLNNQYHVIGSLNNQSQMMDFCVGWKLVQPLHLTPNMIHALIAQYGMKNNLGNLTGKPLIEKISIIFNAIGILQPLHQIPNEDGGLVLLFGNEPHPQETIKKIQSICKERETTMHIYPNMGKSLYETVKSEEPTALDGLDNKSRLCHSQSTITVALQKLLPDLKVYPGTEIYDASKEKKQQIEAEIENGTAISISFYEKWGHLLQGTPENLERIRAIHYAKTRVTLSETQIYQLMFALVRNTPQGELTAAQIQSIRAGELLPDTLTLTDVKNTLDQLQSEFKFDYGQLQTDGVSYTISMEKADPLKKLLKDNPELPPALQKKLIDKKLKMFDKQIEVIRPTIAKMQPIEIGSAKRIEGYSNNLAHASKELANDLACLIDYEAKKAIAILEGTAAPKQPELYTELVQKREGLNQKNQEEATKFAELDKNYTSEKERQVSELTAFNQQTHIRLDGLAHSISGYVDIYHKEEKAFSKLQYQNVIPDLMWDQLITVKGFLNVGTIDQLCNQRTAMDFDTYEKVKISLDQLSELNTACAHYREQYQNWKQSSIKAAEEYLNPSKLLVRFYRSLFGRGNYQAMIENIESKAAHLDAEFQNTVTQINQDFLSSIQAPAESINLAEKYSQTFRGILESDQIPFAIAPGKLESITIDEVATPLLEKCVAVQKSLAQTTSPHLPEPPQLNLPIELPDHDVHLKSHNIAVNKKAIAKIYDLIQERDSKLYLVNQHVTEAGENKQLLPHVDENSYEYNRCIQLIESNVGAAQQGMVELDQINAQLLALMQTFILDSLDSHTKVAYENLTQQCQVLKKNLDEIQNYCATTEKWLEEGQKQIEETQSKSTEEVAPLTQQVNALREKFPLPQYEDPKGKGKEKLGETPENPSALKLATWCNMQKIYRQVETQIQEKTSEYVNYVNSYLNDDKVSGLTRLWRAWFGTHTKNGIERAQSNAEKLQDTLKQWRVDFDTKLTGAKESDKFQELMRTESDQLLEFLSKNLKDVHEDGSGFNLHSYTTYLIGVTQNCQNELKKSNNSNLWAVEKLTPDQVEKTYKQIVNPPKDNNRGSSI